MDVEILVQALRKVAKAAGVHHSELPRDQASREKVQALANQVASSNAEEAQKAAVAAEANKQKERAAAEKKAAAKAGVAAREHKRKEAEEEADRVAARAAAAGGGELAVLVPQPSCLNTLGYFRMPLGQPEERFFLPGWRTGTAQVLYPL